MTSQNKPAEDTIQHLLGTRFVPAAIAYMKEMTGAEHVEGPGPFFTQQMRYSTVQYVVENDVITSLHVFP